MPSGREKAKKPEKTQRAQQKGRKVTSVILALMLLVGIGLLAYPSVSNYWNSFHSSKVIVSYNDAVDQANQEHLAQMFQEAQGYNQKLLERGEPFQLSKEQQAEYESLLNLNGDGIIGYVEVPSINVSLPIYHGSGEAELQVGCGHLEWSSLPVGGKNTHCVLSGHRGLPSAKLLSDLDQVREGDIFYVDVLDQTLTYEVDQILIVEPQDTSALTVVKGEDLCTLVTCTPYGINSHRLLVRGHRIKTPFDGSRLMADAVQIEPLIVAAALAAIMIVIALIYVLLSDRRKIQRAHAGRDAYKALRGEGPAPQGHKSRK